MNPNIASTAAANALSGEKSFKTVSFAVTGDYETDLVSAVVACVNVGLEAPHSYEGAYKIAARALRYLAKRYADEAQAAEKASKALAAKMSAHRQQAVGGLSSTPANANEDYSTWMDRVLSQCRQNP